MSLADRLRSAVRWPGRPPAFQTGSAEETSPVEILVLRLGHADVREDGLRLSRHQFGGALVGLPVGAGECHEGAGLAESVAGLAVYGEGLLAEFDGCAVCFLGLRCLAEGCQGLALHHAERVVAGQGQRLFGVGAGLVVPARFL